MKIKKLLHKIKNIEALLNIISLIVIVLIQEKTEEPLRTIFIIEWCVVIILITWRDYNLKMELEKEEEKNKRDEYAKKVLSKITQLQDIKANYFREKTCPHSKEFCFYIVDRLPYIPLQCYLFMVKYMHIDF